MPRAQCPGYGKRSAHTSVIAGVRLETFVYRPPDRPVLHNSDVAPMTTAYQKFSLPWLLVLFGSLGVAVYALLGYTMRPLGSLVHPEMKIAYEVHSLGVYVHIFASLIALALGPFQFSQKLRARKIALHRALGWIYLLCVLVGGIAGLYISRIAFGGFVSTAGFAFLAILWLFTGFLALRTIRRKEVDLHRRWMIRNFALTFAAVTLRIYLGLFFAAGLPFETFYPVLAWISWVPNILLAEWVVLSRSESI